MLGNGKMQDSHQRASHPAIYRQSFDNHAFEAHEPSLVRRNFSDARLESQPINRFTQGQFRDHGFDLPLRMPVVVQPSVYEMDHLVTFDVGTTTGVLTLADGVRKLRQMESGLGIWTRRVLLSVDQREVAVMEKGSGLELESFPVNQIREPVCFDKHNIPNVFNNLVIFIVQKESWTRLPSTMNIFQCIGVSAHEAVEDIKAACTGKFPRQERDVLRPIAPAKVDSKESDDEIYAKTNKPKKTESNETTNTPSGAVIANRVVILNHCFDDIESCIARIQESARQFKESKQRDVNGDEPNLLSKRDLVDCLQKFKLCLNLIVELKDILRNPSASELLHSIFAPLELVVHVCRDKNGQAKFVESIISPLLTAETCRFLETHLEAAELTLLRSLGQSWTVPRESWSGPAPSPYLPKFRRPNASEGSQSVDSQNSRNSQSNDVGKNAVKTNGSKSRVNGDTTEHEHFITAQQTYLNELQTNGKRVCVVTQSRRKDDPREIDVYTDEVVEVLDDFARNWWQIRNSKNDVGYAPKTILKPYSGFTAGTPNNV